jgi:hypothetical protein
MIEFQIVLDVYQDTQGGRTVKAYVRSSDRESAIKKYRYLEGLVNNKRAARELFEWSRENLSITGTIVGLDGLYAVTWIKMI